jgi:WD40 repeat protein
MMSAGLGMKPVAPANLTARAVMRIFWAVLFSIAPLSTAFGQTSPAAVANGNPPLVNFVAPSSGTMNSRYVTLVLEISASGTAVEYTLEHNGGELARERFAKDALSPRTIRRHDVLLAPGQNLFRASLRGPAKPSAPFVPRRFSDPLPSPQAAAIEREHTAELTLTFLPGARDDAAPQFIGQVGHTSDVAKTAWARDGTLLASYAAGRVLIWDVRTGRQIRRIDGDDNNTMIFDPSGQWLLTGEGRRISVWHVASGALIRSLSLPDSTGRVKAIAISDEFLVVSATDGRLFFWHTVDWKPLGSVRAHGRSIEALALVPGTTHIVVGSHDGTASLWDFKSPTLLKTFHHGAPIDAVTASADKSIMASSGRDHTVRLWNTDTGAQLQTFRSHSNANALSVSADGKALAASGNLGLRVWDLDTGSEVWARKNVRGATFSPAGPIIAGGVQFEEQSLRLWDGRTGEELRTLVSYGGTVHRVGFAKDGNHLRYVADGQQWWDLREGRLINIDPHALLHTTLMNRIDFSDDWTIAAIPFPQEVLILDMEQQKEVRRPLNDCVRFKVAGSLCTVALSGDGSVYAVLTQNSEIRVRAVRAKSKKVATIRVAPPAKNKPPESSFPFPVEPPSFDGWVSELFRRFVLSYDGALLAITAPMTHPDIEIWKVSARTKFRTLPSARRSISAMEFSRDSALLGAAGDDGRIEVWDVNGAKLLHTLRAHTGAVLTISFSSDAELIASGGSDGTVRLWRARSGEQLASLSTISTKPPVWLVTTPDGRYDTNSPGDLPGVSWVLPSDPLTPLPIESFIKEYYEPQLLAKVLRGEKLPDVKLLENLNRVQPEVEIAEVKSQGDSGHVSVVVNVREGKRQIEVGENIKEMRTREVKDLRVFRDGQLVGYAPPMSGPIELKEGEARIELSGIKVPTDGRESVEFSAYAFNEDWVKSLTAKRKHAIQGELEPRAARAYIISLGMNAYENAAWNLMYAANDARETQRLLGDALERSGKFEEVVRIGLLSEPNSDVRVIKERVKAVFDLLSGREVAAPVKASLPNSAQIKKANPEDLLLISYAGHGAADGAGQFYLYPYDIGAGATRQPLSELYPRLISSEELSHWLRDVDAGEMTMIVDACQSAASVEGQGFKPGPMGSRGLGQLAYDKGMRVLAASQAEEWAFEIEDLKHGVLSYALLREGLESYKADWAPQDEQILAGEWLKWGVKRVPELYEALASGAFKRREGAVVEERAQRLNVQRPALFDFRRSAEDFELTEPAQ